MPRPKEIDFGFVHEDSKIWRLDIPSEEMSITELESNLDIHYLDKEDTDDWDLTLRELIESPEKEPGHYEKIKNLQMKYPIEIYFFGGSWKILDGVHRFCKAVMEGKKTITVRKVTPEMISKILKETA
ncbi:MAG: hypothetical protein HYY51_03705 [Candidatus Magasanikbacteria bacterium]|nr:hypothetical protein [Candidatus Magasanikbacteria bacterium]